MNTLSQSYIEIDNVTYHFHSLDEFGFVINLNLASGSRSEGLLTLGPDQLPVAFRVRENNAGTIKCSFSDISLSGTEMIQSYLRKQQRGFVEGEFDSQSYDELAQGLAGAEPTITPETTGPVANAKRDGQAISSDGSSKNPSEAASSIQPQPTPAAPTSALASNTPSNTSNPSRGRADSHNAKAGIRSLALMLIMFALVGLGITAFYLLYSRSTLTIGNSALVGNYLPVNVKAEGEIIDLLVAEGDVVKEGDLLMRLKNPAMRIEHEQCVAKLATAKSKVAALQKQLKNAEKRIAIASKKLALDLVVAKSELASAAKFHELAKINFELLEPARHSGAITAPELEVVHQELLLAEANKIAAQNATEQIEFAQEAIKDNVLILGDRFDDEIGRLTAELEIAEAEQKEAQQALSVAFQQFDNLNVRAPRDGTVYVTYRQLGEYVKIADPTIGLSYKGKVWAAGQVSASQSQRVRPGQPVKVIAPSLGRTFEGVVSAVGHRAMYSPGHYTADFRGETATDVPIKVVIQDMPEDVPSGIRLQMAINTGFGLDWLDRTLGYSLRSFSDGQPIDTELKDKVRKDKVRKAEVRNEKSDIDGELVREVVAEL